MGIHRFHGAINSRRDQNQADPNVLFRCGHDPCSHDKGCVNQWAKRYSGLTHGRTGAGDRMTTIAIPRLRWKIGALLGTGVLINYFDRISLSVAGPQLQKTLGLSATKLGLLFSAF